eukprot:COSAG01_NODE_9375_length_2463_cov_251.083756_2_plen_284_part_00
MHLYGFRRLKSSGENAESRHYFACSQQTTWTSCAASAPFPHCSLLGHAPVDQNGELTGHHLPPPPPLQCPHARGCTATPPAQGGRAARGACSGTRSRGCVAAVAATQVDVLGAAEEVAHQLPGRPVRCAQGPAALQIAAPRRAEEDVPQALDVVQLVDGLEDLEPADDELLRGCLLLELGAAGALHLVGHQGRDRVHLWPAATAGAAGTPLVAVLRDSRACAWALAHAWQAPSPRGPSCREGGCPGRFYGPASCTLCLFFGGSVPVAGGRSLGGGAGQCTEIL